MLETLGSLLLIAAMIFIVIGLFYERRLKVAAVPTLPLIKRTIIQVINTHIKGKTQPKKIAELGSGWGGISFLMAKNFPQSCITGYEFFFAPYWVSKLLGMRCSNVDFHQKDLFEQPLGDYDVIVFYLTPKLTAMLKEKFDKELKPGTLVISNAFPLPDIDPVEIIETKTLAKIKIFVYRF